MFKHLSSPPSIGMFGYSKSAHYLAQRIPRNAHFFSAGEFIKGNLKATLIDGRHPSKKTPTNPLQKTENQHWSQEIPAIPKETLEAHIAEMDIIHLRVPLVGIIPYIELINTHAKTNAIVIFTNAQDPKLLQRLRPDLRPICLEIFEALVCDNHQKEKVLCAEKETIRVFAKSAEDFLSSLPHLTEILPGKIIPIIGELIPCLLNGGNVTYHPSILLLGHVVDALLENFGLKKTERAITYAIENLPEILEKSPSIPIDPKKRFYVDAPDWTPKILKKIGEEMEIIYAFFHRLYDTQQDQQSENYARLSKALKHCPQWILERIDASALKRLDTPSTYSEWLNSWDTHFSGTYMAKLYGHHTGAKFSEDPSPKTEEKILDDTRRWLSEEIYGPLLIPCTPKGHINFNHRFLHEDVGNILTRILISATVLGMRLSETPTLFSLIKIYESLGKVALYKENEKAPPALGWTEEAIQEAFHQKEVPTERQLRDLFFQNAPVVKSKL